MWSYKKGGIILTLEEIQNYNPTKEERKEMERKMKEISKKAIQECKKLFQIITPETYFKRHPELKLSEVIEELNPSGNEEEDKRKLVSKWIATEYQKNCIKKARTEQEENFFIISCEYLIYRNFDEHFSFLNN